MYLLTGQYFLTVENTEWYWPTSSNLLFHIIPVAISELAFRCRDVSFQEEGADVHDGCLTALW